MEYQNKILASEHKLYAYKTYCTKEKRGLASGSPLFHVVALLHDDNFNFKLLNDDAVDGKYVVFKVEIGCHCQNSSWFVGSAPRNRLARTGFGGTLLTEERQRVLSGYNDESL